MYCTQCGTNNSEDMKFCAKCGAPLQASPVARVQNVPNYLVQAVLVALFCCLPFGIVAIVYAGQVNGKIQANDYNGAVDSSRKAKTWCWVSFGVGLGCIILYIVFVGLAGLIGYLGTE